MTAWFVIAAILNLPAVNLLYQLLLVLVLAVAALATARQARRGLSLTFGLLALLHLAGAALVGLDLAGLMFGHALLPPLDRALTTLDLLALGLAFNFPNWRPARLTTLALGLLTLAALVAGWLVWAPAAYSGTPAYFNGSLQDTAWLAAQVALITINLLLLAWQGPPGWAVAAVALLLLFAGQGAHYLWPIGNSDLPTTVHLAGLVAWPLLAALIAAGRPHRAAEVLPTAAEPVTLPIEATQPIRPVVLTASDRVEPVAAHPPAPVPAAPPEVVPFPPAFDRRRTDRRANPAPAPADGLQRQLSEVQQQLQTRAANVNALQSRVEAQARQIATLRTELNEVQSQVEATPAVEPLELRPPTLPVRRPGELIDAESVANPPASATSNGAGQPAGRNLGPTLAPATHSGQTGANTTALPSTPPSASEHPSNPASGALAEGHRLDLSLPRAQALCPHLGLSYDRDSRQAFASHNNRCYGCPSATEVTLSHQDQFCLSVAHSDCPVFTGATPNPRAPIGAAETNGRKAGKPGRRASLFGGKSESH